VNEHRNMALSDNERLEFLGDAVLELLVSQYLYRKFPEIPEGKLTKLRASMVREDSLAEFARECGFDQYIRLGKGEENSGGRQRNWMQVLFHMRWITKQNYKKYCNVPAMSLSTIA